MGFLLAVVFLNSGHEFDAYKTENEDEPRKDIISTQLQERMVGLVESYLTSIEKIDDKDAGLLENDLFHLGRVVDRSVLDMLDDWLSAKSIERDRQLGVPASDETYLNIDNTFRILKIVEIFANKEVVKEKKYGVEASALAIVDKKKILEAKGVII